MLAKAAGVSLRSVRRILEAHQLAPHRIRTLKLSTDPKFAEKLQDVVGLYVDPPAHAVVLSVDEKRSHGEGWRPTLQQGEVATRLTLEATHANCH